MTATTRRRGRRVAGVAAAAVSSVAVAAAGLAADPPAGTQPSTTQPSATQPLVGSPSGIQPTTTGPATTHPATTQASATQPAVDPAMAGRVDGLVAQLADPSFRVRKRAADELERIGEPAEPALRERATRGDLSPDARTAIEVLLRQAAERRRVGATLVTLDLNQVEPLAAVGAVLKRGGFRLSDDAERLLRARADRKVDVRLDREPFWAALRQVAGGAGLAFAGLETAERRVILAPAGGGGGGGADPAAADGPAAPVASDGPFLLTVGRVEVTVRKVIDFAARRNPAAALANPAGPPVRVSLSAWAEPRVRPTAWVIEGVTECVADTGKPLTVNTYYYGRSNKVNDGTATYLSIGGDTAGAKAIARMKVKANFVLQWKTEPLEVDDVHKGVQELTRRVAGHRVVVRTVAKATEDTWTYEVSVLRDGRSQAEWTVLQQVLDRDACRLLDADGKPLQSRGNGLSLGTDEIRVSGTASRAGGAGEPRKLRWELPTKVESLPAVFEFTDVPLP